MHSQIFFFLINMHLQFDDTITPKKKGKKSVQQINNVPIYMNQGINRSYGHT